jgi:hypothetical protein
MGWFSMSARPFRSGGRRVAAVVVVTGGLIAALGVAGVGATPRAAEPTDPALQGLAAKSARSDPKRQAELVAGEDQRITRALLSVQTRKDEKITGPYRSKGTLVLTARKRPYSWDDLRRLSADQLLPQADGSFLLREQILVGPGATLSISPSRPLKLRMSSGPDGFTSLVTDGGRIRLNGTATAPISITSWDESRGRPDADLGDGRAYVRASGQLVVTNTKFSRLGFWSGRTGGVSVVSSSEIPTTGLSGSAATGVLNDPVAKRVTSHTDVLPAGKLPSTAQEENQSFASSISDATMTGNAFGLFISGASGPRVVDTVISRSLVDGLVLHRNVDAATVTGVKVEGSAVDGVVVNREVEGSILTRLDVRNNGRDGVVLSGSPLAQGPSPSGASTRPFGNNVLTTSKSIGNGRIGVHVAGGVAISVQGNTVSGGHSGIVVSDAAKDAQVSSNTVKDVQANGIQVRDGSKVELTSNNVIGAATGVHVRDAVAMLEDNSTSGVTLHAFTFVGVVAGSEAVGNQLRGSGTSPIDTVRVSGEGPEVHDTDDSGWSRTVTKDSLLSILLHPLTMVWIGIGMLLLAMSRPRRGGTRTPYQADPLISGGGPSQAADDQPAAGSAPEREKPVYLNPNHPDATPTQQPPARPHRPRVPTAHPNQPVHSGHSGHQGQAGYRPRPVPALQPRRVQPSQSRSQQPGFPDYADPEPPVAAEWLQTPHQSYPLPRQAPENRQEYDEPEMRDDWTSPDEWDGEDRAEPGPTAGTVIDLAIAESRRNPEPPRRRRVVGR